MSQEGPLHIFEAAANNDLRAVKEFVEKRYVSLKKHDYFDQTVAHIAARRGFLSLLEYVLEQDPYLLSALDGRNHTIFHRAVQEGGLATVKFLISEYKMDPYTPVGDKYGNTALHIAAEAGQLDVVQYLIEEMGMDADMKNAFRQSPAFQAALNKQFEVIRYLIEWRKVDVSGVDIKNENILFPLTRRSDLRSTRYILDDRRVHFDINWRGNLNKTITYWATRLQNLDFLSYLVEDKGGDINIPDNEGWTPLHLAAHLGKLATVRYLIDHRANFRAKNQEGKTPVELTKNFRVRNFLEGLSVRRSRFGRSLPEEFAPVGDRIRSSSVEGLHKLLQSTRTSVDALVDHDFKSIDEKYVQLDTFLAVFGAVFRHFRSYQTEKHSHPSLLSPHQIILNRLDPIAIAAVYADVDFRN